MVRLIESGLDRIVGSHGAPETQVAETPWLPLDDAEALDGEAEWVPQLWRDMDTTLAAAPLGDPAPRSCWAGRAAPVPPSEVARLGYLAGIVATILR